MSSLLIFQAGLQANLEGLEDAVIHLQRGDALAEFRFDDLLAVVLVRPDRPHPGPERHGDGGSGPKARRGLSHHTDRGSSVRVPRPLQGTPVDLLRLGGQ